MRSIQSLFILVLAFGLAASQTYNVNDAMEFVYASSLTNCMMGDIETWQCGEVCQYLQGYGLFYTEIIQYLGNQSLAYTLMVNPTTKRFITAFRATLGQEQLLLEAVESADEEYSLHNVPGARVQLYFNRHYTGNVRSPFLLQFQRAAEKYSDYTFIFTGHSLGAALATHAAFDIILSNIVPASQVIMYNYGSPRVGNFEFAQAVVNTIPTVFRITHYQDIIPHVPICIVDPSGGCTHSNDEVIGPVWEAWHLWTEIYYTANFGDDYTTCQGGEDPTCSDQWDLDQCNIVYHMQYLGVGMVCGSNSTLGLWSKLEDQPPGQAFGSYYN